MNEHEKAPEGSDKPALEQRLEEAFERELSSPLRQILQTYRWYIAFTDSSQQPTQISLHTTRDEAIGAACDLLSQHRNVLQVGPLLEVDNVIGSDAIRGLHAARLVR